MKKWFQNKKREKQFNSELKVLLSVHEKKNPLNLKRNDIVNSDLTDEEKDTLVGMIDGQLDIIDKDVRTLGLTMSQFFTERTIDKMVPIGVELACASYDVVDKGLMGYRDNCNYVNFHITNDQEYSVHAHEVANELYLKVSTDERSYNKQRKLSKMPLKQSVKDKLMKRHTDRDEERKQDVLNVVEVLKSDDPRELREISIIQTVVNFTIDDIEAPDNLLALSKRINVFEDSLISTDLYKTFLYKGFAHKIFDHSADLHNPLRFELAENLLTSLNETGHYVITNVTPPTRGGEMSS